MLCWYCVLWMKHETTQDAITTNIRVHDMITRNDINAAVANYLLKGGKIKKLSPTREKNFFWGMGFKGFRNPDERADRVLEILDAIEVDLFEQEEREDLLLAAYYEESAK